MTTVNTDWFGRARPGLWFGEYNADWHAAFPGKWEGNEEIPGGFYAGDVWGSTTIDWDRQWFACRGARLPKKVWRIPDAQAENDRRDALLRAEIDEHVRRNR